MAIALTSGRGGARRDTCRTIGKQSRAIEQRLAALGLSQRELIARSQVSKATARELQHNTVQRRRSDRTLEALSVALDWHPGHLAALLGGRRPPKLAEPVVRPDGDVPSRLLVIEDQLRELNEKLDGMAAMSERLDEINASVEAVVRHVVGNRESPGR